MGDYVENIKMYGTTDSYSTEPVSAVNLLYLIQANHLLQGELEHRSPKARYKRTSKKGYKQQLVQIERRQARLRRIHQRFSTGNKPLQESRGSRSNDVDPAVHHHIGVGENKPIHIGRFCQEHADDPAAMVRPFHEFLHCLDLIFGSEFPYQVTKTFSSTYQGHNIAE